MDVGRLRDDVRAGRVGVDQLLEVIEVLSRKLDETGRLLDEAHRRIAELEKEVGGPPAGKPEEPYSVRSEERRRERSGRRKPKKGKRGRRLRTRDKLEMAVRTEKVFPAGVPESECKLSHTRPVWRLENGQAVLVAYEIHRGPGNQYGKIPGVLGRSEFGVEISVAIAYQVYIVGLSFDNVCLLLRFFQNLSLRKSQIDALLNQLSRHWESEFDSLCALLANSAVVHTDETSWSINSVWAFLSEKARLMFFGVHKDAATLRQILDPATFAGIVVSDDAAVYANFTRSQKCWAHLLRKAIKLTLLDPDRKVYRQFTDELLEIYRRAGRARRDRRLSDKGRERKVAELGSAVIELCATKTFPARTEGLEHDFRLLVEELLRLHWADALFTFVTARPVTMPNGERMPVAGTNNESERTLRSCADARKMGRTNKTVRGARRQTVTVSVLESLRLQLETFTLGSVVDEVLRWSATGRSRFAKLLEKDRRSARGRRTGAQAKPDSALHRPAATTGKSLLDSLLPVPSG